MRLSNLDGGVTPKSLTVRQRQRPESARQRRSIERLRRRFRRAINVVYFCCAALRIIRDRRWGDMVEEAENVLLEATPREVPASYFDAVSGYPLPPGWVTRGLPIKIQQQICTLAKNKIVRLLNPIARLRTLRLQLRAVARTFIRENGTRGGVSVSALRRGSPFLSTWSDGQLQQLLGSAALRVLRPGMWLVPPSIRGDSRVCGFCLLQGHVVEIAGPQRGVGAERRAAPTGVVLEEGAIICEQRRILESAATSGFTARSVVVALELDWRLMEAVGAAAEPQSALRRYVVHNRQQNMLAMRLLSAAGLRRLPFFQHWDDGDLQHVAAQLKPRVLFNGEDAATQGAPLAEFLVISRGKLSIMIDGAVRAVISPGSSFGEDVMIAEERSPATLRSCGVCEVWVATKAVVASVIKSTALRHAVQAAVMERRAHFLNLVRDRRHLISRLRDAMDDSELLLPESVLQLLEQQLQPQIFCAGDRMATGGGEMNTLVLVEAGRVTETGPACGAKGPHPVACAAASAPCILGARFLSAPRSKWPASITAMRNTECWVLDRRAAHQVLRFHPNLLLHLQRQNVGSVAAAAAASPRALSTARSTAGAGGGAGARLRGGARSAGSGTDTAMIPVAPSSAPQLRSTGRAGVWKQRQAARAAAEAEVRRAVAVAEARERARVAPPEIEDNHHLSMAEFEGLHAIVAAPKQVFVAFRREIADQHEQQRRLTRLSRREGAQQQQQHSPGSTAAAALSPAPPSAQASAARVQQLLAVVPRTAEERRDVRTNEADLARSPANGRADSPGSAPCPAAAASAPGRSQRRLARSPAAAGVAALEARTLRGIIAKHERHVRTQRDVCARESSLAAVISANPFSSLKRRRREPLQKMSPMGELYFATPQTGHVTPFIASSYDHVVAPSFVSAHGFSEIDAAGR